MPIRGSPNGACHARPQAGRNRPEWVVAINRNAWSQSIGTAGRDHPVRALEAFHSRKIILEHRPGGAKLVSDVYLIPKPSGLLDRLLSGGLRQLQSRDEAGP
jgi:hypothetical protein